MSIATTPKDPYIAGLFTESDQIVNLICFFYDLPNQSGPNAREKIVRGHSRTIEMPTCLERDLLVMPIGNTFDVDIQVIRTQCESGHKNFALTYIQVKKVDPGLQAVCPAHLKSTSKSNQRKIAKLGNSSGVHHF